MKNKLLIILASFLLITGCNDDGPELKAPSFIKPHLHHLYKTVPDCFRANNLATEKYNCSLTVKTTPATGEYKGHPTFQRDGKTVGGVTYGSCRKSSTIVMPVIGERYSQGVLQHEVCHAYDFCQPCRLGHPAEYATCCEPWPYLKSAGTNLIHCITKEVDGIMISVTVLDDSVSSLQDDEEWFFNLVYTLDPEYVEEHLENYYSND